ncbi:hypothetical protein MC885_005342 [Smutsia gigantea]|nr:hypothetical protein MC885_005342 [Smutsia gigantea]
MRSRVAGQAVSSETAETLLVQLALDFALIIVRTAHTGPGTANMPNTLQANACVTGLSNTGHLQPGSSVIRHIPENKWKISYTITHANP